MNIGNQIRALRISKGKTQEQLAKLLRTTQSVIARMENPEYEKTRINTLLRIASKLDAELYVDFRYWLPMESAPLDGTRVLCGWFHHGSSHMAVLSYYPEWHGENRGAWLLEDDFEARFKPSEYHKTPPLDYARPTHWLPLPKQPNIKKEKKI